MLSNVLNRAIEPPPQKKVKTAEGQENAQAILPATSIVETAEGQKITHTTLPQQSVAIPRPSLNVGGGIVITGCSHVTVNYHTMTEEN